MTALDWHVWVVERVQKSRAARGLSQTRGGGDDRRVKVRIGKGFGAHGLVFMREAGGRVE
jgi:hypothetical protein